MAELVTFPLSSALVDLKKRLPKVWCPNCEAVQLVMVIYPGKHETSLKAMTLPA